MTKQLLYAHWKASRWVLLPFVLLAFGLPLLMLRMAGVVTSFGQSHSGYALVESTRMWMPFFPLLAFTTGFGLALSGWAWDHRGNHVYALSLPVPRQKYVLRKMAVGASLLLIPATAIWIASFLGSALIELPEGIRTYPLEFGARFLVAALLAYALGFAMASGTMRTTITIVSVFLLVLVFGTILIEYLRDSLNAPHLMTPLDLTVRALTSWPGPFNVFGGNWALIDV